MGFDDIQSSPMFGSSRRFTGREAEAPCGPSHAGSYQALRVYPATLPIDCTASSDRLPSSSQNFVKPAALR
jgi:hypothetical protein